MNTRSKPQIDDFILGDAPEEDSGISPSSPPHNREAEEAVIGAVLINPDSYYDVAEIVTADDFFIHRNRWVFQAYKTLVDTGTPIDLLTVCTALDKEGKLHEIGGSAYLTGLINQVPSSAHAASYAALVFEFSMRRELVAKASEIASLAYTAFTSVDDMLNSYENKVKLADSTTHIRDDTQDSDSAADELAEKVRNNTPTGVLTHFPEFDKFEAMGGFPIGAVLLIGDSSFGKSAWTLQICEQVALSGSTAVYFGFESTNTQMVIRRLSGQVNVDHLSKKVRAGALTADEQARVLKALKHGYKGKYGGRLKFNSKAVTLRAIESAIRKHRPRIAVIDQLSQVADQPSQNPTMNLLLNFTALKRLGNKYDCCVLVVHAMSPDESSKFFKLNATASAQPQKAANNIPNINAIPWATQIKFLTDAMLILVPDVKNNLQKAVVLNILIWIMKDRDGARFVPTFWRYDLTQQWFTDVPKAQNAQVPSSASPSP